MNIIQSEKKVRNGYVLAFVILLLSYFLIYLNTLEMEKRSKTVDRTNATILNLELLVSVMKDAETGIRGYALTRDSNLLKPFLNIQQRSDSIYQIVKASITSDSVQQIRLGLLKSEIRSKIQFMENAASILNKPDFEYKNLVEVGFPDTKIMSNIRKNVKIMQEQENYKLEERVKKFNETYASLKITNLISLILAIFLAIVSLLTFEKENKAKKYTGQNWRPGLKNSKLLIRSWLN